LASSTIGLSFGDLLGSDLSKIWFHRGADSIWRDMGYQNSLDCKIELNSPDIFSLGLFFWNRFLTAMYLSQIIGESTIHTQDVVKG